MRIRVCVLFTVIAFITAGSSMAAVIHVPGDQPTIQAGIDAASNGDTVLVADGVYTGPGNRDIDFGGRNIIVKSENGPLSCIIDCQGSAGDPHNGFNLKNGETTPAAIEGFTIRNGYTLGCGGAINNAGFYFATVMIRNNRIENCHADYYGGGIYGYVHYLTLIGNTIINNSAGQYGGGVYSDGGLDLRDNVIALNTAGYWGGGVYSLDVDMQGNRIIDNQADYGGGMFCEGYMYGDMDNTLFAGNHAVVDGGAIMTMGETSLFMRNCTLTGNSAGNVGAVIYWFYGTYFPEISGDDCIIWGNDPDDLGTIFWPGNLSLVYTDIAGGWPGEGNIDADPLFVSGPFGDWHLSQTAAGQPADSPCLDSGSALATELCYATVGDLRCMSELSTRSDQELDLGQVDMGYHYEPASTVSAGITCTPSVGTLPFVVSMEVELTHWLTSLTRHIAGRIDVVLAGGGLISNWRTGYTSMSSGQNYTTFWNQDIPALQSLVGVNLLMIQAMDVTPAPYNQPPYPPAGDLASDNCTVTGIAP